MYLREQRNIHKMEYNTTFKKLRQHHMSKLKLEKGLMVRVQMMTLYSHAMWLDQIISLNLSFFISKSEVIPHKDVGKIKWLNVWETSSTVSCKGQALKFCSLFLRFISISNTDQAAKGTSTKISLVS